MGKKKDNKPSNWALVVPINDTLHKIVYMHGDKYTGEEEIYTKAKTEYLLENGIPVIQAKDSFYDVVSPKFFRLFNDLRWFRRKKV